MAADDTPDVPTYRDRERKQVHDWRRDEARRLGLTNIEADLFADSDADLGRLRDLIEHRGWSAAQAVAVLL